MVTLELNSLHQPLAGPDIKDLFGNVARFVIHSMYLPNSVSQNANHIPHGELQVLVIQAAPAQSPKVSRVLAAIIKPNSHVSHVQLHRQIVPHKQFLHDIADLLATPTQHTLWGLR